MKKNPYRKWVIEYFIVLLLLCLGIATINYLIDSANTYHPDFEETMAMSLADNKTIYYKGNFNERLLHKLYINKTNDIKNTIIVGSSRGMLLDKHIISENNMFNHCVSGGIFEDMYAVLGGYKQKKMLPNSVIIEIDPWCLNENNKEDRWGTWFDLYQYLNDIISNDMSIKEKIAFDSFLTNLFSFSLFISNIRYGVKNFLSLKKIREQSMFTHRIDETYYTRFDDGSILYSDQYVRQAESNISKKISSAIGTNVYSQMEGFSDISEKKKAQLNNLIIWLKKNNIEVTLFLAPFPPTIYEYFMNSQFVVVADVENYLKSLSNMFNIKIRGSFDPNKIGLSDTDFYDRLHAKKEKTAFIWALIYNNKATIKLSP